MAARLRTGWVLLILIISLLMGCGGAPRLISQAPREPEGPRLLAEGSLPSQSALVAHRAYWEMQVRHADAAPTEIERIAQAHGGYLVRAQRWTESEQTHATVTIAVPLSRYADARHALLGTGTLLEESAAGERVVMDGTNTEQTLLSHITIQVHPITGAALEASPEPSSWRPVQTFRQAFAVFSAIFLRLFDIFIWTAVVVGPLWLTAIGLRALWKRRYRL